MNRLDNPFRWHFVVALAITLGVAVGVLIPLLGLGFLEWDGWKADWNWNFK